MEVSNQTPVKKPKRLTSLVWNDFDRVKKPDGMVAICKHCKKKLSGSSTSGTSHLRNHLKRCLKRNNRDIQQLLVVREKKNNFRHEEDLRVLDHKFDERLDSKFDQERSRFDLARMIILHEYPLAIVEHVGFKRFVENLQPSFKMMSFDRVKDDCMQIYEKERQKVYEVLDKVPGRISLTADIWTSLQDHLYLCLTAHYIDEAWSLQKKILNFVAINPCTAQGLSELIMSRIRDWDIDRKLFSITLDNSSTNDNAISIIRERLFENRLLLSNGKLFHVRCAKHILSVIVQDVLEAMHDVIHKIRESVRYIRSSESLQEKFNELVQEFEVISEKNLFLDCPTQWNSTFGMLEAAVEYRDAFSHLQEYEPSYTILISDLEWERVIEINNYLKLFIEVTNVFSGVKYPTANLYFPEICDIHVQLIEWCKNSDFLISSLALKTKNKFDTYWSICIPVLAIAAILDPRFKMKLVEYYYPQIYCSNSDECIKDVSNIIRDLYNEYTNRICSTLSSLDQGFTCDVQSGSGLNGTSETRDRLQGFDKFLHDTSNNQNMKSELDKYLEEPVFPRNVDFNILNWWKVNSPKYPVMSMMARDILGIPMSAIVSSDSAFEIGGGVLDSHQSSLSPDVLQALICTHDWFRMELEEYEPVLSQPAALCIAPN